MTLPFLLASALAVTAPDGAAVCRVTPPDLGADARLETTNLPGGVAWRIRYDGAGPRTVAREEWTFDFGKDLRCWPVSHAQGEYVPRTLSAIASLKPNRRGTAECPLVVEGDGWTAALGDAGVTDYARLRFASGERPGQLKAVLEGPASFTAPFATPWRYVHVAKDCVALANAQPAFLDALNAPSRIADTSWIKPGKVLRVCSLNEQDGRACVDFAKRNNFQYVELDAGWYGPERTGDPLKPNAYVKPVIDYANANGVGVILYVNDVPLHKNRDAILDQLSAWGVKGVKYGFVQVGGQAARKWVLDAIQAAADRRLLVDIHDEYRLTGIQKTYPNVLTVEGIRGNEEMPTAAHDAALSRTRSPTSSRSRASIRADSSSSSGTSVRRRSRNRTPRSTSGARFPARSTRRASSRARSARSPSSRAAPAGSGSWAASTPARSASSPCRSRSPAPAGSRCASSATSTPTTPNRAPTSRASRSRSIPPTPSPSPPP